MQEYSAPHTLVGTLCTTLCVALVLLTNTDRTQHNLPPLHLDAHLMIAAQEKANDMATNDYFAHVSPTGISPWHWFAQAGYQYRFAGENLAEGFVDTNSIENAWMTSPAHRANILDTNYTDIGIASAKGVYAGEETAFIVEEFGSPDIFIKDSSP